jgi:iron(III) transport system substrate-binding protein
MMQQMRRFLQSCCALSLLAAAGCWSASSDDLVLYVALDSEFSQPMLEEFERQSGLSTAPRFDVESTKTVGLTEALIAERDRTRCDVFWNNEILNTLRLERLGMLEAYHSPQAENYPAMYRHAEGKWHGLAARARVLIVNTDLVPEAERPQSIEAFTDEKWRGRCGMAKPLFGTTATHAACLFAVWGKQRASDYFRAAKANDVQILAGNKQVALAVAAGQLAFGMTDTDDAIIELESGHPVAIVYPDQQDDEVGTLFIPNTVAILKGCPHPEAARRFIDFVLSPTVETKLAQGRSAQIPLSSEVDVPVRVETPRTVRAMEVDFARAAEQWDATRQFLRDEFTLD